MARARVNRRQVVGALARALQAHVKLMIIIILIMIIRAPKWTFSAGFVKTPSGQIAFCGYKVRSLSLLNFGWRATGLPISGQI